MLVKGGEFVLCVQVLSGFVSDLMRKNVPVLVTFHLL